MKGEAAVKILLTTVFAAMMATAAIIVRMKAAKKPATVKKIILPPLFMSTGAFMFLYEPTRPEPLQVLEALSVGMLFSLLLIKTTKFEIREQEIYLKRSKAFVFILVGLLVIRIIMKLVIGGSVDVEELSGMFYLLAYGMIVPWRVAMYFSYRKLEKEMHSKQLLEA